MSAVPMLVRDIFDFPSHALRQHRRRTLLSLLGVTIGVAAVVFLTGLAEGARNYVLGQFSTLGSNLVIVIPGKSETTGVIPGVGSPPNDLTLDDARHLEQRLRGAHRIIPVATGIDFVSHLERRRQLVVIGTTSDFLQARKLTLERGQFLPPSDMDVGAQVLVLGHKAARELFGQSDPIGQPIRVGSTRMRVIGVLADRGQQLGQNVDDMVYAPTATVMRMFNRSSLFRIIVEAYAFEDIEAVKQQVLEILTERHGEEDVTLLTQDAVLTSLGGILRALTLGLGAIAAISLAVAGIGIMNVMLISVAERKSEIGLLKALGAKRFEILLLFLCEASLLSIAGGIVGVVAGWALVKTVVLIYPSLPATTPLWAVASVMGLATAIGPLFGSVSAWKAAKLDPVRALTRL